MQTTTTRAQQRAIDEATGVIDSLASLIDDLDEQLNAARSHLGDLEQRAADLGAEMYEEHRLATDPYTRNADASKAVQAFHRTVNARLALDNPRREAASTVIELQRRLLFLKAGRQEWRQRLDELEAGTVVPEPEPISEVDVSPEAAALLCSPAAPAVSDGAEAPEPAGRRWWWG